MIRLKVTKVFPPDEIKWNSINIFDKFYAFSLSFSTNPDEAT